MKAAACREGNAGLWIRPHSLPQGRATALTGSRGTIAGIMPGHLSLWKVRRPDDGVLEIRGIPDSPGRAADVNAMKASKTPKKLSAAEREALLATLEARFEKHAKRHPGLAWPTVQARLGERPEKLWSLREMEDSGGEPDVTSHDKKTGELVFIDCSPETPKGRVSVCYDREGWESRKEHRPKDTAMDMAAAMGIELLTEEEYRGLQQLGEFDLKTSSWVMTPPDIRKLGGALFGDRRFGHVFIYHNGAQSYYAARGFRGVLRV